jgi:alkylation response protein AidB-like acyl-CoA dehydrogenase
MARSAAWAAAAGELAPETAAEYCTDAAQKVSGEAIQLHGGIAITWEHDAHLIFKRAHALRQLALGHLARA